MFFVRRPFYTNTISVVAAFSSQPRVGSAVTDEISLMAMGIHRLNWMETIGTLPQQHIIVFRKKP
jgi:hypothetical protein